MIDYELMTIEELESLNVELMRERAEVRARQKLVAIALDKARVKAGAEAKVAKMSDDEKAALAQALHADGIPSEEAFGEPGCD